jgi:hypothetical protein
MRLGAGGIQPTAVGVGLPVQIVQEVSFCRGKSGFPYFRPFHFLPSEKGQVFVGR